MGKARYRGKAGGAAAAILISAAIAAGCVNNPGDTQGDLNKYSGPVRVKSLNDTGGDGTTSASIVPIERIQNTDYVALDDVATAIGFNDQWLENGNYGIGDRDARWVFRPGESDVRSGEETVRLPAPTVKRSNRLYAPVSGLPMLFGNVTSFRMTGNSLSFIPKPLASDVGADDRLAPFRDAVPTRGEGKLRAHSAGGIGGFDAQGANGGASDASAGGKHADLIEEAKKYLGVRYNFGAEPYEKSKTFDCSSFVQLLFGERGVQMPRTADEQGRMGTSVSRDALETGDLLFFSVPGRFKSDSTVGHVGIYMGNGSMIHSSPEPQDGVQITDINKPYWQRTFLFAKRVLP